MNFEDLNLTQAAQYIRDGQISPVEYIHGLLSRIEQVDPRIEAWVTVCREQALVEAKACERECRQGSFRGPLHGIGIGVKDIFFTKGLRTSAGAKFLADFIPGYDAHCLTSLRKAGAIVLGKTVTTEFASFDPGPTRNPWNTAHTPGGSSSGSAAAVAARMCPAALGSQTVGSIGRPAAYCGVVGIMPTQSRVSRSGVFPVSWTLDHIGGLTRSVADARLLLEGLSGESISVTRRSERVRMGVVRGFFSAKATPETSEIHERLLTKLGAHFDIVELELPAVFEIQNSILATILRTEVASAHTEYYRKHSMLYSRKLRGLVETGMLVDSLSYLRARRLQKVYQREMRKMIDACDVVISPGAMDTAPEGLGYTGDPGFSGPWALADFPTLTLPCGIASNGMPVGIQLSAPPMNESRLFSVAEQVEGAIGFKATPPSN